MTEYCECKEICNKCGKEKKKALDIFDDDAPLISLVNS